MKNNNIFKYIFIIFAIGIITYSVYALYFKNNDNEEVQESEEETEIQVPKDLRLGISNYDNINPLISNNKEILNMDKLIFEPLINITNDYKTELCLAKECSQISKTSYIIKVDNDKKWQDGSSVIAKDVQFTIDRLKEGRSVYSYNVEKVNEVEIIDSETIKINLIEPVNNFEYNLAFPILSHNYYMDEDFYETQKTPIGTGMFKITQMDGGNITLEKNEKWWNKKNQEPRIEKISIKIFSEMGELYNSFKLGNLDFFTTTNSEIENYIGTIGYTKNEFRGRMFDYLAFNCQSNILKNVEVRKAIGYAIDKSNLISTVYGNKVTSSNFPIDFGSYLYQDEFVSSGYNQEQAKRILIENGWEYKNNRWQRTVEYKTERINLSLTVNRDNPQRLATAENIKAQLEQIGIKVTLNKVNTAQYKNILQNKGYEMIVTGVYNSYSPDINTFFGEDNLQNYYNDEMNALLNDIKSISKEEILKEKYEKIINIYNNDLPFVSLYRDKVYTIRSQNLVGDMTPNNYSSYYNFNTWIRL